MIEAISQKLAALKLKFDALNQRERWLIGAAAFCLLYGLYSVILSPVYAMQAKVKAELEHGQAELNDLTLQLNTMVGDKNKKQSPETLRVEQLTTEIDQLALEIDALQKDMVLPNKVPDLLSDILNENDALSLVSLTTLAPTGLLESDTTPKVAANSAINHQAVDIFKHGVELTVEGRYLDLLNYVAGLEKMPWQMLWSGATLTVENKPKTQFPLSQLKLTVYTVSLDKEWLSI